MSALLDSLATAFNGDAARRSVLDDALRDGLPGARSEAWKYTSLRALERRSFAAVDSVPEIGIEAVAHIPAPRLVFVNGRHVPALSALASLPEGVSLQLLSEAVSAGGEAARFLTRRFERSDEIFARLNAALASEGVLLRAEAGTVSAQPLHLVFIGAEDGADRGWHLRNLIELRAGAKLALVEHHFAGRLGDACKPSA